MKNVKLKFATLHVCVRVVDMFGVFHVLDTLCYKSWSNAILGWTACGDKRSVCYSATGFWNKSSATKIFHLYFKISLLSAWLFSPWLNFKLIRADFFLLLVSVSVSTLTNNLNLMICSDVKVKLILFELLKRSVFIAVEIF